MGATTCDPITPSAEASTLTPPAFLERTAALQRRAVHQREHLAVAVVDVDDLALTNATGGHAAGDACLAVVGVTLARGGGGGRLVCRWGSGAFAVVFADTDRTDAGEQLRTDLAALHDRTVAGGHRVTFCAGVTDLDPLGVISLEVARARRLADRAKRHGRARVVDAAA